MFLNKKAQGISINVIIIAAIALLVLVILSVLLLRGGGTIVDGTSCEALPGAQCAPDCASLSTGTTIFSVNTGAPCSDDTLRCCVKIGT